MFQVEGKGALQQMLRMVKTAVCVFAAALIFPKIGQGNAVVISQGVGDADLCGNAGDEAVLTLVRFIGKDEGVFSHDVIGHVGETGKSYPGKQR